jgi:hypothetical protein
MRRAYVLSSVAFLLVAVVMPGADAARAEGFVDLYIGGAFTADARVTAEADPPGSFSELEESFDVEFANSVSGGGRAGYWLDSVPWLGFGLDGSYFRAAEKSRPKEPSILKLRVIPVSGLVMLRYPMLKSSEFPRGQVYVYGAGGPAAFVTMATAELKDLDLPEDFDDSYVDIGFDTRVGVKLFHAVQSWGVFAEYRFTYSRQSEFDGDIKGVPFELEVDQLMTHHFALGLGFHF